MRRYRFFFQTTLVRQSFNILQSKDWLKFVCFTNKSIKYSLNHSSTCKFWADKICLLKSWTEKYVYDEKEMELSICTSLPLAYILYIGSDVHNTLF